MLYRLCDESGKVLAERNEFRHLKDAFDESGLEKALVYAGNEINPAEYPNYAGNEKEPTFIATKETSCAEWNRVAREVDDF